jgi:zinc-ribbon domain
MKKCQTCGHENVDTMQFCVECGATLPNAPIVVNFGGGASGAGQQNPFGDSMQTQQSGGRGNFGNQPNQFQTPFPNVPPPQPPRSKKTFLIIGGILTLFLLVFIAGAAVIGYNMMKKESTPTPTPTPASPTPTATSSKSPTPTKSASPTGSPKETPANTSGATADLDRVWVDYNVKEGGKNGMRIHVKFTLHKLKDVDSYLAIYFEKQNGDKLYTNNKTYRSKDGQVAVYKSLKPAYEDTIYDDAQLFIPYEEFNLDAGKYDLKMDIDVIYENGDLIQHLEFYDFEYTEG